VQCLEHKPHILNGVHMVDNDFIVV